MIPKKFNDYFFIFALVIFLVLSVGGSYAYSKSRSADKIKTIGSSEKDAINKKEESVKSVSTTKTNNEPSNKTNTDSNPKTTNSTNNKSTSNQKSKAYSAPICNRVVIPYSTKTTYVNYLYEGESREEGGENGYRNDCTYSDGTFIKGITVVAVDKNIYIGTKKRETSVTPIPPKTRQEAENYCRNKVPYNSSAWERCIIAYLSQ